MFLLDAVQGTMHFLSNIIYYILAVSYHTGRGIIYAISLVLGCLREICAAIVIIGEEFYRFLAELDGNISVILRYCRTTTNSGLGAALDVISLFFKQLANFFTNTKIHTKLLATECGRFITKSILLVQRALLLIADSAWWLLTIIPKTIARILIEIGDGLVFSISEISRLFVMLVRNIIDDVFRYTIAVVIIFTLLTHRRRLLRLLRVSLQKIKLFYRISRNSLFRLRLRWDSTQRRRPVTEPARAHRIHRVPLPSPIRESVPRPISEPVPRPISEPMPRPVNESLSRPNREPLSRPSLESLSHPSRESMPRPSRESLSRPSRESLSRSSGELLSHASRSSPSTTNKLLESQRCVICQDQQKCVLLLPCKHLCLCENCADYMVYTTQTQQSCPLCRGEIHQSLSVYT